VDNPAVTPEEAHLPGKLANDPAFMADPFGAYARWRDAGPVHRLSTPDGMHVWLVTRYADIRAALADPRLSLNRENARPGGYRGFSLPPALNANLLNLDPPDHTRIRRLVAKAFTPLRVRALRPHVQQHTDALLDRVVDRDQADFIGEFAAPLPIAVICDLLGVPTENREDFRAWTNTLLAPDLGEPSAAKDAVGNMLHFLTTLIAAKRAGTRDDLLSAMITARDEHDRLSEDELISLAFLILWAGYENSVHLIGNSILALLLRPEQAAMLRAEPTLPGSAIEELLRFADPNQYAIRRFPTEDIEIGGTRIPRGDTVLLCLASANRDPERFTEPEALDLTRAENPHLSFGAGVHYCLGAPLARLEADIAISTVLRRFPNLTLAIPAHELSWRPSFRSRSLTELPVSSACPGAR
jgi:cytochrome P450